LEDWEQGTGLAGYLWQELFYSGKVISKADLRKLNQTPAFKGKFEGVETNKRLESLFNKRL
jgi:hypothetical protein